MRRSLVTGDPLREAGASLQGLGRGGGDKRLPPGPPAQEPPVPWILQAPQPHGDGSGSKSQRTKRLCDFCFESGL